MLNYDYKKYDHDSKPQSVVKLAWSIVLSSILSDHVVSPIFPDKSYVKTIDVLWTNIDKIGWKAIFIGQFRQKCCPLKNITYFQNKFYGIFLTKK